MIDLSLSCLYFFIYKHTIVLLPYIDLLKLFPAIHLARGNHESKSVNKIYGFEGEVRSKLNETFMELFAEVFCCLPLAHVINEKVFVVHGGLFSVDGVKLSDIRTIDQFCEPPEEGMLLSTIIIYFHNYIVVGMLLTKPS